MAKITPESIADLKALFQDNEKALGANFSQLIDFFNNNKVTDNGDGTFTVGTLTVDASKLYDLIKNSSPNILPLDNEFTGKNTFDIAPINKANGKPYITEDSVPPVDLSNYPTKDQLATKADDSKVVHTTGAEEVSGQKTFDTAPIDKTTGNPYITKSDVTTAVSAATANMADTTKATNFTNGLQSGGVDVATAADLKSLEASAWHTITGKSDSLSAYTCMYRKNNEQKYVDLVLYGIMGIAKNVYLNKPDTQTELLDLKNIVSTPKNVRGMIACASPSTSGGGATYDLEISGTKLKFAWSDHNVLSTGKTVVSANDDGDLFMRITFD